VLIDRLSLFHHDSLCLCGLSSIHIDVVVVFGRLMVVGFLGHLEYTLSCFLFVLVS